MDISIITAAMKNTLMECHEREMLGQEPMNPQNFKFSSAFYSRRLIELRYYQCANGRRKAGFFVTMKAKNILKLYTQITPEN